MKIKTILVHRVKNMGNYESERLEMIAELDEDDEDPGAAAIALRKTVKNLLYTTLDSEQGFDEDKAPF